MSNAELAKLLRSAASALEHGRRTTARKKLMQVAGEVLLLDELLGLLNQDIFTDAYEYAHRVNRVGAIVEHLTQQRTHPSNRKRGSNELG